MRGREEPGARHKGVLSAWVKPCVKSKLKVINIIRIGAVITAWIFFVC